jgi:hypothetical protein
MKFLNFFLFFVGHFCPPGFGSGSESLVTDKAVVTNFISDDMFCLCLGCGTNRRTECASRHKRAYRRCPRFVIRTFCLVVGILLQPLLETCRSTLLSPGVRYQHLKPGTGMLSINLIIRFQFAYRMH